jgi:hypothetical protein
MFFGSVLKQGQSYTFDENEVSKGDVLNISNAVLASGNKVTIMLYTGRTIYQEQCSRLSGSDFDSESPIRYP